MACSLSLGAPCVYLSTRPWVAGTEGPHLPGSAPLGTFSPAPRRWSPPNRESLAPLNDLQDPLNTPKVCPLQRFRGAWFAKDNLRIS